MIGSRFQPATLVLAALACADAGDRAVTAGGLVRRRARQRGDPDRRKLGTGVERRRLDSRRHTERGHRPQGGG